MVVRRSRIRSMVIVGYPVLIMVVEVDANDQGEQVKWWVRGEGEDVNPNGCLWCLIYMNKRMERARKKRKRRSMINENKAVLSSSQNNRQYRAQRAYVRKKRCMHVIRGSLMFLGSLLTLVFNPIEANRGSLLHLLDPS